MVDGLRRTGGDLILSVRLTPRAGQDRIDGPVMLSDGSRVLGVRVRAVPEDGRANAALVAVVADAAGVSRSKVRIQSGAAGRRKTLRIIGADAAEEATLACLLAD
jgi:uncharacterized protein